MMCYFLSCTCTAHFSPSYVLLYFSLHCITSYVILLCQFVIYPCHILHLYSFIFALHFLPTTLLKPNLLYFNHCLIRPLLFCCFTLYVSLQYHFMYCTALFNWAFIALLLCFICISSVSLHVLHCFMNSSSISPIFSIYVF